MLEIQVPGHCTCNFTSLSEKLGWYGIDTHWFQDWLADRCQVVRGGDEVKPITHGVIQGSLLGPILYLLFTNDLASYLDTKTVIYADDVQFLHVAPPKRTLELKADVFILFIYFHIVTIPSIQEWLFRVSCHWSIRGWQGLNTLTH